MYCVLILCKYADDVVYEKKSRNKILLACIDAIKTVCVRERETERERRRCVCVLCVYVCCVCVCV